MKIKAYLSRDEFEDMKSEGKSLLNSYSKCIGSLDFFTAEVGLDEVVIEGWLIIDED